METRALIELLDRDGQPRHVVRVTDWPVSIGRAIDCDIVLDDPHVAPHHASFVMRGGGVHVEPLHTVNGVLLGRARIVGESVLLPVTATLQMGSTTMRVRLPGEPLPAEVPMVDVHQGAGRRAAWRVLLAALTAGWFGFTQWVSSDPGQSGSAAASLYLAAPIALVVWCGLWALGSKLFQHRFAFWPHLEAALFWPLVGTVAMALSGQLAFALSMPWIAKAGHVLGLLAVAMLLWRHLCIVLPQRRGALAILLGCVVVVGGGLNVAERLRHQQPAVGDLYLSTISLPALRMAHPVSPDAFVRSAAPLEATLSKWAKSGGGDDEDD